MYDVYVNECVCVVCEVCVGVGGWYGGVCVCVHVCGMCVVLCVRGVYLCVCVCADKSQKPPHSGFLQFQYFLLPLFLSLTFLVVSLPRGSSPTPSGLAVTLGKVRWA